MTVTTKIKLDLTTRGVVPWVDAVQDDKYSRNLEIALYENGGVWNIPLGTNPIVRYAKADGTGGNYNLLPDGSAACTISGNTLTVALAPQVCTVPGPVQLAVGLISANTEINTFSIGINVHRNPGIDVVSDDYCQTIDAAGYYDLDLSGAVSFDTASADSMEAVDFDVSGAWNWARVKAAVESGQLVRLHFMENKSLREVAVLLTDVYSVDGSGAYYLQCVYAPRDSANYVKLRLEFVFEEEYGYSAFLIFTPCAAGVDGQEGGYFIPEVSQPQSNIIEFRYTGSREGMPEIAPQRITLPGGGTSQVIDLDETLTQSGKAADAKAVGDALKAFPVAVSEDGYTEISGLRRVTEIAVVRSGRTITVAAALEGGAASTSVITLDTDGYPARIVTDGVECDVSWEGFDG